MPARGSPGLFAACHVLHRLLAPRHPPDALPSLVPASSAQRHMRDPRTAPIRAAQLAGQAHSQHACPRARTPGHAHTFTYDAPVAPQPGSPPARARDSSQTNSPAEHSRSAPIPIHNAKTTYALRPRTQRRQGKLSIPQRTLWRLPLLETPPPGDDRDRTGDPLLAKQVLSQLSYAPMRNQASG